MTIEDARKLWISMLGDLPSSKQLAEVTRVLVGAADALDGKQEAAVTDAIDALDNARAQDWLPR